LAEIKLIVGLGNPGSQYQYTRHNVGAELVARLAETYRINLASDRSYKGRIGRGIIEGVDVRLLLPETYMNLSGQSVGAVARFYKLPVDSILIAYDELAFEPGQIRLKTGGGHNGHNGVASVIDGLGNDRGFHRLRIGVGHPGHKDQVMAYLTGVRIPADERALIEATYDLDRKVLDHLLHGRMQKAMTALHSPPQASEED
jgi:PTH1 family peptidyl-tRNA hydrolase